MGNRAVGGGVGAGCGIVGLLGLLVSVALVVWLAGQALDGTSRTAVGPTDPTPAVGPDDPTSAGAGSLTLPSSLGGIGGAGSLQLEPGGPVAAGATVAVSADGLGAGPGPISVSTCLSHQSTAGGVAAACDVTSTMATEVDQRGMLAATVTVHRVIEVFGAAYDCGAFPGACSLVAHRGGSLAETWAAPLTYAPDDAAPATDATVPPRG
jgi:hypothetical protein